jgi:uncharacterized protein (DUF58 family)
MLGSLLARHPRLANRLWGFTPPERGTVVLVHRRVYIVPARLGWIFAMTLLVLLIGSINYALSLGFALTFLLGGLALVAMVHTARNLARTAISVGRAGPVFAGESGQFRLFLDGRVPFVPAGGVTEAVLAVPAAKRGWLPLGRVMLETRFPLGLFRAWSYVEPDARCLVYPRPERTPLPRSSANAETGSRRAQALGNEDFASLRAYQRSDSPRHVAWKAVAKSDDMLTKQFSGEAASELWLDWNLLPPALALEERLSRLTGWVIAAERTGSDFGLRLPGVEIGMGRGDAHCSACLEALALYSLP